MDQWKDTAPEPADAMATIEHLRQRVRDLTERVRGLTELVSDTEDALTMALKERDAALARVATLMDLYDNVSFDRDALKNDAEQKGAING